MYFFFVVKKSNNHPNWVKLCQKSTTFLYHNEKPFTKYNNHQNISPYRTIIYIYIQHWSNTNGMVTSFHNKEYNSTVSEGRKMLFKLWRGIKVLLYSYQDHTCSMDMLNTIIVILHSEALRCSLPYSYHISEFNNEISYCLNWWEEE